VADRVARALVVDVGRVRTPDVGTVDALARLALTARRRGCRLLLVRCSGALAELLDLAGLSDVVGLGDPSAVEVGRQPEQLEQPRAEEDGDAADPVA
jgi:anti-anti-sigma regulatory factor